MLMPVIVFRALSSLSRRIGGCGRVHGALHSHGEYVDPVWCWTPGDVESALVPVRTSNIQMT